MTIVSLTGHSSVDAREAWFGTLVPEADYSLLGVLELAIFNHQPPATITLKNRQRRQTGQDSAVRRDRTLSSDNKQ